MRNRILSVLLALIFVCVPQMSVYAVPECVQVEVAEEASHEVEVVDDTELASTLPKLPAPTNLKWNNIKENGKTVYGYVSWGLVSKSHGEYDVFIYCDGEYVTRANWINCYDKGTGRFGFKLFSLMDFTKSGKYTFKVRAVGDGINYSDSDFATSGIFDFTVPSSILNTVQNVRWKEGGIITHSPVKNAAGYQYEIYVRRSYSGNISPVRTVWNLISNVPLENQPSLVEKDLSTDINRILTNPSHSDVVEIYVKVKALSYDITKYRNGDSSDYSDAYILREISEDIAGSIDSAVDKIETGNITAEEALDDFLGYMEENDKSNLDLAVSMLTDENIEQNIDTLEEKFIEQTGVGVTVQSTAQDENYLSDRGIDVNEIKVKGAALNSSNNQDVSLNFSEADPTISADENYYKNSVAVNIGMDGVKNEQKLDIPVIIEMPVPTGVVPHRLFILHYHADGSYEQIQPAIIYNGDKAYARFILTSFSDFVFCNINDDFLMGNVYSGDEIDESSEKISIKDAIALAQYLSGYNTNLTNEQLAAANLCTDDDVMGATVDVNINQNDLDFLVQYIAANEEYYG